MAKGTIYLDVIIDDKGTMKRVAVGAAQANAALAQAGQSAATADRNLKGAARASSNSTKNFSKLAQGISGGIVPAYATLAAQIFALTAVYRAFLDIADFRILLEGQQALVASTGVAYTALSKSIQLATESQLSYTDAAQAGAIGIAAGLNTGQIEKIAATANIISKTLGRDLTDTFNRLVRGITKAEPELLDELGIILRLKDASEAYAITIGKQAKDLTLYEKTQGVYNFTLDQADKKFKAIKGDAEPAANAVRQLGIAFTGVYNKIKPLLDVGVEGFARVLTDNIQTTILAVSLLASTVIKQALPSVESLKESSIAATAQMKSGFANASTAVTKYSKVTKVALRELRGGKNAIKDVNAELAASGAKVPTAFLSAASYAPNKKDIDNAIKDLTRFEKAMIRTNTTVVTNASSKFRGLTLEQVQVSKEALISIEKNQARWVQVSVAGAKTVGASIAGAYTVGKAAAAGFFAFAKAGLTTLGRWALTALNWAGWIGLLVIAYDLIKGIVSSLTSTETDTIISKSNRELKEFKERTEAVQKDFEKMREGMEAALVGTLGERVTWLGNAATALNVDSIGDKFREIGKLQSDTIAANKVIADSTPEFNKLREDAAELAKAASYLTAVPGFEGFNVAPEASNAIGKLNENIKENTKLVDQNNIVVLETEKAIAGQLLGYARINPELTQYVSRLEEMVSGTKISRTELKSLFDTITESQKKAASSAASYHAMTEAITSFNTKVAESQKLGELASTYSELANINEHYSDTIEYAVGTLTAQQHAENSAIISIYNSIKAVAEKNIALERTVQLEQAVLSSSKEAAAFIPSSRASVEAEKYNEALENRIKLEELNLKTYTLSIKSQSFEARARTQVENEAIRQQRAQIETEGQILALQKERLIVTSALGAEIHNITKLSTLAQEDLANAKDNLTVNKELTGLYKNTAEAKAQEIKLAEKQRSYDVKQLDLVKKQYDDIIKFANVYKQQNVLTTVQLKIVNDIIRGYEHQNELLDSQITAAERLFKIQQNTLALEQAQAVIAEQYDRINTELEITSIYLAAESGAFKDQAVALNDVNKQLNTVKSSVAAINAIEEQNAELRKKLKDPNEDVNILRDQIAANEAQIVQAKRKLEVENANLNVLKLQANELYQMQQNARAVFSSSLTEAISGAIKGTETDISTIINNIATAIFDSLADSAAKMLSDSLLKGLGIDATSAEEAAIKAAHIEGAATLDEKITGAFSKGALETKMAIKTGFEEALPASSRGGSAESIPVSYAPTSPQDATNSAPDKFSAKDIAINSPDIAELNKKLNPDASWMSKLGEFFSANSSWLLGLAGLLGGLMAGNSAGGGKGRQAVSGILGIAATLAAAYVTKGASTTTTTSTASSTATPSYSIPPFAKGGVATSPVIAGEGKMNEAIIPLPDGKSVPVMMTGGSTNSNNVAVNVNITPSGQAQTSAKASSAQAANLGRAISAAVQSELAKQKRPGGMLSPYGV